MGRKVEREKIATLATGKSRLNRAFGFTLIELSVVLFIIALFSALLTIRVEGVFTGGDLRLASRIIIGEITRLRGLAAYTHKEQALGFNIDENHFYTFPPVAEENEDRSERFSGEKEAQKKIIGLPDGVRLEDVVILRMGKIQEGEARIMFYANGSVDRSLIHLRNEKDHVYTLEISPPTGHVMIHDKYIDQKMEQ